MTIVSCAPQTEKIAGTLAAAQQDMEFHSRLAVGRHHLENLLAGFSAMAAAGDPEGAGGPPQGRPPCRGRTRRRAPTHVTGEVLSRLAPEGRHVILTTSNLTLVYNGPDIEYTGTYQCWTTEMGPECTPWHLQRQLGYRASRLEMVGAPVPFSVRGLSALELTVMMEFNVLGFAQVEREAGHCRKAGEEVEKCDQAAYRRTKWFEPVMHARQAAGREAQGWANSTGFPADLVKSTEPRSQVRSPSGTGTPKPTTTTRS